MRHISPIGRIGHIGGAPVAAVLLSAWAAAVVGQDASGQYPDRWVYVGRNLSQDAHVDDIQGIVETARQHGLNGMLLAAGLEGVAGWDAPRLARLERVKAMCHQSQIEIVPIIWSVGYGSGLRADRNFAAGIACRNLPFAVEGKEARFVPDPDLKIANPGFEEFAGNSMKGYRFHDRPGVASFPDTEVFHSGSASLRFENFGQFKHGHARVMQEVAAKPHRQYRFTCWVKTEGLEPTRAFKIQAYGSKGCIAPRSFRIEPTMDWRKLTLVFNSLQHDKVRMYAGLWGGKSGKIWFDDFAFEEMALVNVLRRPGAPLKVTSDDGQTVFEEGRDFEPIQDDKLSFSRPRPDNPAIRLTPNSHIADGQRLRVSYYHGMSINRGQVSVCMSNPKLYDYWRDSAAAIQKHLNPAKWFLSMDEIRMGGSCELCKARGMTMGQMLGDCITQQAQIIREARPDAKVYIWSDMLDPNHNAHGNYYLVEGDFTGSWEHVPKDIVIACWYFSRRDKSMPFFSSLGFETLAGAYYDGDTTENIEGWIATCNQTPKCRGIMYTTWRNKYKLLPAYGDLVNARSRPR